ncbi:hypothetical protein [Streptomyces prunicolor]|uniref:hypothetical protein n=1 Tax=Streptomyces prunicolor TaxID=67348 RepID=UPI0033C7C50C
MPEATRSYATRDCPAEQAGGKRRRLNSAGERGSVRVLPGGGGERGQMPLGVRQYGEAIGRRGRWREPSDRLHPPSWGVPAGSPEASRSIRPPTGSGEAESGGVGARAHSEPGDCARPRPGDRARGESAVRD